MAFVPCIICFSQNDSRITLLEKKMNYICDTHDQVLRAKIERENYGFYSCFTLTMSELTASKVEMWGQGKLREMCEYSFAGGWLVFVFDLCCWHIGERSISFDCWMREIETTETQFNCAWLFENCLQVF